MAFITTALSTAFSNISAGTLITAGSAIIGGFAELQASNFQKQIALQNAQIAEENADRAILDSQLRQQEQDELTAAFIGDQIAQQGASGLSVSSGSSRRVRSTARRLGRQDALNIRKAGEDEARNFRIQATGQRNRATALGTRGQTSLLGGFLKASSSLVSRARPTNSSFNRSLFT